MERTGVKLTQAHNPRSTIFLPMSAAIASPENVETTITARAFPTAALTNPSIYPCTVSQSGFAFMIIRSSLLAFLEATFSKSAFEHAMTTVVLSVW